MASKAKAAAPSQSKSSTKKKGGNASKSGKGKNEKPSVWARFKQSLKDLKSEIKKITWATGKDTLKNTLVVLMVVLVVGIGVWVADALLVKLREVVYNLSTQDAETAIIAMKAMIGMWL